MDVSLTEHFRRSEFLRSTTVPSIVQYEPTKSELTNLARLASYLEQIRSVYGPMQITGGLRPVGFRAAYYIDSDGKRVDTPDGITMTEALQADGFQASDTSDHIPGVGTDFKFLRIFDTNRYVAAYNDIQRMVSTRQVILYLVRGRGGNLYADHFHVAAVMPGYSKEKGEAYAWIEIDGKRVTNEETPNA